MWFYFNYDTDHITFTKDSAGRLRWDSVNTIPKDKKAELTVVFTESSHDEMLDLIVQKTGKCDNFTRWEILSKLMDKRVGEVIIHAKDQDIYEGSRTLLRRCWRVRSLPSLRKTLVVIGIWLWE